MNRMIGLAALVVSSATMAQIGPQVSGGGVPGNPNLLGGGPKPALLDPAVGAHIETRPTSSVPVMFRWSAPANAPSPQRYRLCVSLRSASCTSSDAAVYEVGQVTQYQASVPPRFHDKSLQWAVAACGPGYGGGFQQAGASNTDCNWAQPRPLDAGYQSPSIALLAPGDRITGRTASQRFTWQEPQGIALDGYRMCLADDATLCRQPSIPTTQGMIVPVASGRAFADIDLRPLRTSTARSMYWTVLSCRAGSCEVASGQAVRAFTIPAPLPPPALALPVDDSFEPQNPPLTAPIGAVTASHLSGPRTYPATIDFKWTPVSGATMHKLCISQSPGCSGVGTRVIDTRWPDNESVEHNSLTALHGTRATWQVTACDAIGCGAWSTARNVTIKAIPGQAALNTPAAGADVTTLGNNPLIFTWSAVPFAEYYLVGADGVVLKAAPPSRPVTNPPTPPPTTCTAARGRFPYSGATQWTVQACNVVGCGAPATPRPITINQPVSGGASSSGGAGSRGFSGGASAYNEDQCR
jgi:hypothetical protein